MARLPHVTPKRLFLSLVSVVLLLGAVTLIWLFPVRYIDEPYEYPIVPGSAEWAEMESQTERSELLTIATEKYREEKQVRMENGILARHYAGAFFTAAAKSGFESAFPRPYIP